MTYGGLITVVSSNLEYELYRKLTGYEHDYVGFIYPNSKIIILSTYNGSIAKPETLKSLTEDINCKNVTIYPLIGIRDALELAVFNALVLTNHEHYDFYKSILNRFIYHNDEHTGYYLVNHIISQLTHIDVIPKDKLIFPEIVGEKYIHNITQLKIVQPRTDTYNSLGKFARYFLDEYLANEFFRERIYSMEIQNFDISYILSLKNTINNIIDDINNNVTPVLELDKFIITFNKILSQHSLESIFFEEKDLNTGILISNKSDKLKINESYTLPLKDANLFMFSRTQLIEILRYLDSIEKYDVRYLSLAKEITKVLSKL